MILNPLDHPICLAQPKRLTPVTSWKEHIPFAMYLVDILRPKVIVELGTHLGDSYCAFCQAVKELDVAARCFAVDTWRGDQHAGFYEADVLEDLRAHHDPLYGSFSSLIPSTFDEALKHFADGSISLLHIDGCHTYEAVKHDFQSWLPKMGKGGVVLFHDTNVRERNFGISHFWDEIKQHYPHFEFLHGHGLGVLAVSQVQAKELLELFHAGDEETVRIRQFFFELGRRLYREADTEEASVTIPNQADIQGEEPERPNVLQLFWPRNGNYSENDSLEERIEMTGQLTRYLLRLPVSAQSPLRLDPGNRPAYVEIARIALYAEDKAAQEGRELLASWSADNQFGGLIPASGIVCLNGGASFRFICLDQDPQLVLDGLPSRTDSREWLLELSFSASPDLAPVFQDELKQRREEADALSIRLAETLQGLQTLQSELKHSEQARQTLQAQFKSESEQMQRKAGEMESALQALAADLQAKEASEQALVAERDNQERLAISLQVEIAEKAKTVEQLSATLTQLETQLQTKENQLQEKALALEEKESQLQEKSHQLHRITHSLGWRLLSQYGRFKYGFLLPAYRSARNSGEVLFKRKSSLAVEPIHQLCLTDDAQLWESTGSDPQFKLTGSLPIGWTEIRIELEPKGLVQGHTRLYIDRGSGYSEADSLDLGMAGREQRAYALLGSDVTALRLDPFESAGKFRLKKLSFQRVSARQTMRGKASDKNPRRPDGVFPFARFSLARIKSFRQKHGRLPRLHELPSAMRRTLQVWQQSQAQAASFAVDNAVAPHAYAISAPLDSYDAWLEVNEWNARRESVLRERLSSVATPVFLSVVMPVYNPPPEFLEKALQSVANQVYQNWELCIADDASTDPFVRTVLQRWAEQDSRIRVVFRDENGHISRATNSAAELAQGDFLVLMDQDDELTPDALAEVALYLSEHSETDLLYSDDDKINAQGQRFAPQFKPDWSPELLLSYMYFSHLFVLRKSVFVQAGGLRVGFEGSQDYDLALRASEITDHVGHIPKVLYHWRVLPGSTALSGGEKPASLEAGMRAVQEAMDRRGIAATIELPDWALQANCGIFSPQFADEGPRVAILIPTKNNVAVLKTCVESLEKTTYKNFQVVIIDNESDDPETLEFLRRTRHKVLRISNPEGRFNFAAINNRAVEQTDADYVLFLNNDTEVIAANWLSQMVGFLGLQGVGAVGARLLFPDGKIQHAGIVHGYYNGMAGPAFKLLPAWNHGYLSYTMVSRNYSAVTAACMLTRKDLFLQLGGFDEKNFAVAYNDVDYCYRLQSAGHRIAYCPTAELLHHEGYSRGFADNPLEAATFRKKYGDFNERFYNPNLSLEHERFAVDARTIAPATLPPVRALMCAFNLNWEGAPYSQFEMTIQLKEQGILDPIVYSPSDGPLRAAYEERGIQVEVFDHPLSGVYDLTAYESAIARFAKRLEDWQVEVVYGNTRQTFYAIEAAKHLRLPSIWNPRESENWQTYFDYLGADIAARALQCFSYPYKVVFVADATRESCNALNTHHNFITVHNGADQARFAAALSNWPVDAARQELKIAADEVAILLLGTVCERKGQLDLIEAVGRLNEDVVGKLRCFIVGDRPSAYSELLRSELQALPAAKQARVEIVPETSDTALYYAAADLFVCASRLESYPRVILEAMAAGLPIITTPVFGIVEQVRENINALFYQPGDSQALADRLEKLTLDPHLRRKLAANSKHVLETLTDYEAMVEAYGKVFREAWLSGRSR
jgi:GT2 family glycosyltransferase/glycosyltransferase involved in cell wall biosynthesis/predicted  nucleic acid-binding Zn-ribbon protein